CAPTSRMSPAAGRSPTSASAACWRGRPDHRGFGVGPPRPGCTRVPRGGLRTPLQAARRLFLLRPPLPRACYNKSARRPPHPRPPTMSFFAALRVALGALLLHKGRSFLTSLGIILGTGSIIALVAAGDG